MSGGAAVALAIGVPVVLGGGAVAIYFATRKPPLPSARQRQSERSDHIPSAIQPPLPNVGTLAARASAILGNVLASGGGRDMAAEPPMEIRSVPLRPDVQFRSRLRPM